MTQNLRTAIFLSLLCTLVLVAFLYNKNFDAGFLQVFAVSDLLNYLTLMSAIFGGVFAYRILLATSDQRDAGFMPFLHVFSVQFSDTGIEINYGNCGQGPAIDVYWEPTSLGFKLKPRSPHPMVCRPKESTGLSREYLDVDARNFVRSVRSFGFDLLCKDQAGNGYQFIYKKINDSIEFMGTRKNGRLLVSK